jgi:rhodanese-related sulfurtransferase
MRTAFLALLLMTLGCHSQAPGVIELSQERFLSNPPEGVLILDVRTPEEFSSGHVPDAVNIPHDALASRLPELASDRDTPVIVYCERGGRAGKATSVLLDAGYENVFHLAGDMSEWRANGRPTTRP